MATGNFYLHENGIFAIFGMNYEDAKNYVIESYDYMEDEISEDLIYEFMNESVLWEVEYFLDMLKNELPKGLESYTMGIHDDITVIENKQGKRVAEIRLESGYYEGVQVIVETDPYEMFDGYGYWNTQAEMLEEYTPNNKRLLNFIAKITTPLGITARFSNGETMYHKL